MSKVKDTFFGGAEKKAGKAEQRGQEAAGRLTAAQLAQTESEFRPFLEQGAGASLNAQRVLLGLGATDPNAQRRDRLQREISELEAEQQDADSQFGGIFNARTGKALNASGLLGKLLKKSQDQSREQGEIRSSRLEELRAELEGIAAGPQGTAQEQQAQAFQNFVESPGQKFIRDRAQRSLLRNQGAIGGLGGGNVRSALVEQGAGFAQQDFQNQFNRLGITSAGEQALIGRQQAAASGLGSLRGGFGAQQAGAIIGAGQAKSSGITGQAAGLRGGITQLAKIGGQFGGFPTGGLPTG